MYIDTHAANKGSRPPTTIAHRTPPSQENTPLLATFAGQEPPPSYLEATTPHLWSGRASGDEAARLLRASHDGRQGSLELGLVDPFDGAYKQPTYGKNGLRGYICSRAKGRGWKCVVGVLLVVMLLLIAVVAVARHVALGNGKTISPPISISPIIQPDPSPAQPTTHDFPIRWPSRCSKIYTVHTSIFAFPTPPSFSIREAVHHSSGPYKRIAGWIHVVRAPASQPRGSITVKFSYAVSDDVDPARVVYSASDTGLTIGEPENADLFGRLGVTGVKKMDRGVGSCLGMSVVVYVAAGTEVENLDVRAAHLGVQIYAPVSEALRVGNLTSVSLVSGTLDASFFASRCTRLETVAGSISGEYALADLLDVSTVSGSVNIAIAPQAAEAGKSDEPAVFRAKSVSGTVRAEYVRKGLPERDYVVEMESKVGGIEASLVHGSKTVLKSVAGNLRVDLVPFAFNPPSATAARFSSSLESDVRSGETNITIKPPYLSNSAASGPSPLHGLKSSHKSISGAINLVYPDAWEGRLSGKSLTGKIHVEGRELVLLGEVDEPARRSVEARKGEGWEEKSEMRFESVSGGCGARVGRA